MSTGQTLLSIAFFVLLTVAVINANRLILDSDENFYRDEALVQASQFATALMNEVGTKEFDANVVYTRYQGNWEFTAPASLGPNSSEAAAVGALASMILALAYRRLTWKVLKDTSLNTVRITSMALLIGVGASMFTGLFLKLKGGEVVSELLLAAPGGQWGAFVVIMLIVFILGMFIDWMGILFIVIPVITPIAATLGFDAVWFAMMICVNLQTSFLTPPFAYAIFYLRGIAPPEWGLTMADMVRGVIPFVVLILIALGLFVAFPELLLWLPAQMLK